MSLTFNGTAPTEIIVTNDSSFSIAWPTGTKSTTWLSDDTGSWFWFDSFSSTSTYSYTKIYCNDIELTSSEQLIYSTSEVYSTKTTEYKMYASYNGGTLTLRQLVSITTTTQPSSATVDVVGINYEGTFSGQTSLTVLNQNGTNVWGKPYALSISQGANATVSVNRTSSPNQHASTGVLSSGSLVYHGDVLAITASASSGYNLSTFSVNGTAWTSGNSITVSSAITVVTATQALAWHTVWTGENKVVTPPSKTGNITNVSIRSNVPTKISGKFGTSSLPPSISISDNYTYLATKQVGQNITLPNGNTSFQRKADIIAYAKISGSILYFKNDVCPPDSTTPTDSLDSWYDQWCYLTLTKVEQYY